MPNFKRINFATEIAQLKRNIFQLLPDFKEISRRLRETFNIKQVDYIRDYNYIEKAVSISRIHLSDNTKWIDFFYDHMEKYQKKDSISQGNINASGFTTVSQKSLIQNSQWIKDAKKIFGLKDAICIFKSSKLYTEYYYFVFQKSDIDKMIFLMSHLDLLYSFINLSQEKIDSMIKGKRDLLISLPKPTILKPYKGVFEHLSCEQYSFLNDLKKNYNDYSKLTKREIECAHCLARDMSAKEAARYLNISNRTVEKHLENAKNKLGIHKNSSLIKIVVASQNREDI